MPGSAEVLSLYRSFLRSGAHFPNYNIREYIIRRAKDEFRGNRSCSSPESMISSAKEDLAVAKRQSLIYQMYGRTTKNVLELDTLAPGRKPVLV